MRIMWCSNAPWTPTGYGVQTGLFTQKMVKEGWDTFAYGNYGHNGSPMRVAENMLILPASTHEHGLGLMKYYCKQYKPDVMVLLYDLWIIPDQVITLLPLTAYAPIDHDPITPGVEKALQLCLNRLAMSRFAETQMLNSGMDSYYAPHAFDREVYHPLDRSEARQQWGFDENTFLVTMVGANKGGYPSRKGFPQAVKAFSQFLRDVDPTAHLYLHTDKVGYNGTDIAALRDFYGVPGENMSVADRNMMEAGVYTQKRMNYLYNAVDVLLMPSMGEGFGVPAIEAQAAGCPVILSDFTAQSELCHAGWLVEIDEDDLFFTPQGSTMALPRASRIFDCLVNAYQNRNNEELRNLAVHSMSQYEIDHVWETWMKPALTRIAGQGTNVEERQLEVAGA